MFCIQLSIIPKTSPSFTLKETSFNAQIYSLFFLWKRWVKSSLKEWYLSFPILYRFPTFSNLITGSGIFRDIFRDIFYFLGTSYLASKYAPFLTPRFTTRPKSTNFFMSRFAVFSLILNWERGSEAYHPTTNQPSRNPLFTHTPHKTLICKDLGHARLHPINPAPPVTK